MGIEPLDREVRARVALAARLLAAAGLVTAFGHVSTRGAGGFVITSTDPLGSARTDQVVSVADDGTLLSNADSAPLEVAMHTAVYAARPDVGAICRTHSPALAAAGARGLAPVQAHGLGGLAGEVRLFPEPELVTDAVGGGALAEALDDADCLVIAANGGLTTGPDLPAACVAAYYLEERCSVAIAGGHPVAGLSSEQRLSRARWHPAERERAWRWLTWRFGSAKSVD